MQNNPNRRPTGQQPRAQQNPQSRPAAMRNAQAQSTDAIARAQAQRRQAYQAELARRRAAAEKRRREEKKRRREVFVGRLLLFLIIFAVLAAIAAAIFFFQFNKTESEAAPITVRYSCGGAPMESLPADEAYRAGVLYVDYTAAAEYLGMTQIGGADQMRFVIPLAAGDSAGSGREEDVIFTAGSDFVLVNGQSVRMEGTAMLDGEHYRVPASFITEYMRGVTVTEEKNSVDVTRTFTDGVADRIEFTLKSEKGAEPVPESTAPDADKPVIPVPDITVTFATDLSAYEEYMNPADRDAYLTLVNFENRLGSDFVPQELTNLVDTRKDGRATQKMVKTAAKALEAMFIELRAAGYKDLSVTSAYRTYSYQSSLFNMYTDNEMKKNPSLTRAQAEEITVTYSSRPGTSEHQTGLCCDMHNLSSADQAFAKKEAYAWLKENAWKFGFIIRFPEGKEDITKVSFEPWHYRFVGRYHAKAIKDMGLCFEEYIALREG